MKTGAVWFSALSNRRDDGILVIFCVLREAAFDLLTDSTSHREVVHGTTVHGFVEVLRQKNQAIHTRHSKNDQRWRKIWLRRWVGDAMKGARDGGIVWFTGRAYHV